MASPYATPVTKIKDIMPYFRKNEADTSMTFIGKKLEVRIPLKFKKHGMLVDGESVTTLAVCDLIFDDKYQAGLNLLAQITITPTDRSTMTYNGVDYMVLYLKEGDTFMSSYRVVKDSGIVYTLWTEFISNGGLIYTLDYEGLLKFFDHVEELTGEGLGVSKAVYEGIVAYLARDPSNVTKQYRLTNMNRPMQVVPLKSVSRGLSSTIARLAGSYMRDEGITSALRHEVTQNQPFEDLLRGVGLPQPSSEV